MLLLSTASALRPEQAADRRRHLTVLCVLARCRYVTDGVKRVEALLQA